MSMQNAVRFLRDIDSKKYLRHDLHRCKGYDAIFEWLAQEGYAFTGAEFEEVVDHLHVSCATRDEADRLMEKVLWLRMVVANA